MSNITYNKNNEVENLGKIIHKTSLPVPHVYILKFIDPARSFVKIGSTCNLRSRIVAVQSASPYDVQFAYAVKGFGASWHCELETQVHSLLSDKRVRGEWFEVSVSDAIAAIRSVLAIEN